MSVDLDINIVPDIRTIKEEVTDVLVGKIGTTRLRDLLDALEDMHYGAKHIDRLTLPVARERVARAYDTAKAVLSTTPVGVVAPWPESSDFWFGGLGRLIFYSLLLTQGDDLLTQRQVADRLGLEGKWRVSRVAQYQRRGALDFVIDPTAKNLMRERRRVTTAMVDRFLATHPQAEAEERAEEVGEDD